METAKNTPFIILSCVLFILTFSASPISGNKIPDDESENEPVGMLRWIDVQTGRELFSINDIVRFDWDKQIFELTRQSSMDFMTKLTSLDSEFEVKIGNDTVYSGALVSIISSKTYPYPTIMFHRESIDDINPPLFEISGGYPGDSAKGDSRFSKRLKGVLSKAGLLSQIDLKNPPAPIKKDPHGWYGEKEGLRAWVDIFPETFRVGELARVHLDLIGDDYLNTSGHVAEAHATLFANGGKYKYSTKRIFPAHEDDWKTYIIGINPWIPDEDSIDKIAKPGPAEITFEIFIRRVIDEDKSLYSEPVKSVKTGPINLVILSKKKSEVLEEAKIVMTKFQEALKASEWNKALSLCSDVVQTDAKTYESAGIFFRDVVPVEQIISVSNLQTSGGQSGPKNERLSYFCFLRLSEPDDRPTISWQWKLNKADSGWVVDFKNIPLDSWIEKEKLRLQREHEKANQRIKTLREGLKLNLVPLSDQFVIGKPMLFRLEMKNISSEILEYFHTSFMVNDPMEIKDSDGTIISFIEGSCQTAEWPEFVEPGEAVTLADNYDARSQYHITRPGQYTFQFTGHWVLKSNVVRMDIIPGPLPALESIVEDIIPILPKGWNLTRRILPVNELAEKSAEAEAIWINLIGKRRSKGFDSFISIVIFVHTSNESIPHIKLKSHLSEMNFWGDSKWGLVYGKSKEAEQLWPDWKKQVTKALDINTSQRLRLK